MPINSVTEPSLRGSVAIALEKHIQECKDKIVEDAIADFTKLVKERVANVAVDVSNYFSIERLGTDLVIRVKFDGQR